jgi:hypothetical protein
VSGTVFLSRGHLPPTRFPSVSFSQNCLGMPACFNTALAVWRDRILWSTGKRRSVMGLYQIS